MKTSSVNIFTLLAIQRMLQYRFLNLWQVWSFLKMVLMDHGSFMPSYLWKEMVSLVIKWALRLQKTWYCSINTLYLHFLYWFGEQGWRSGESARLPPMWPASIPARYHMWAEFVVGSRLVPSVFPRVLRVSCLHKNNTPNYNSIRTVDYE